MNNCENCKFYIQHYGFDIRDGLYKVSCGHCLERKKLKKDCEKFVAGTNNFKRIKKYTALMSLTKIEIVLNEIKKEIANIKPNLK